MVDIFVDKLIEEFFGEDWFNVVMYFKVIFVSIRVVLKGDNKFVVIGDLIIKGIIKIVILDVILNGMGEYLMFKKQVIGFDVEIVIKCFDFGIDQYVFYVGDEIILCLIIEVQVKQFFVECFFIIFLVFWVVVKVLFVLLYFVVSLVVWCKIVLVGW